MSGDTGNRLDAWFFVSDKNIRTRFYSQLPVLIRFPSLWLCNRNARYGEMAPECAEAYFRYGAALFAKAQAEGGVLGPSAQKAVEEEEEEEEEEEPEGGKEQEKEEGRTWMLKCKEQLLLFCVPDGSTPVLQAQSVSVQHGSMLLQDAAVETARRCLTVAVVASASLSGDSPSPPNC